MDAVQPHWRKTPKKHRGVVLSDCKILCAETGTLKIGAARERPVGFGFDNQAIVARPSWRILQSTFV